MANHKIPWRQTIRFTEKQHELLKEISEEMGLSINQLVILCTHEWLENHGYVGKKIPQPIVNNITYKLDGEETDRKM